MTLGTKKKTDAAAAKCNAAKGYIERGVEVSRTTLSTEKAWRDALEANFGITL